MNLEVSIRGFIVAVIFGAGFHVGWALIGLLVALAAKALGVNP